MPRLKKGPKCVASHPVAVYPLVSPLPVVTSQSEFSEQFNQPTSAVITESGTVFVLDCVNNHVLARDPSGNAQIKCYHDKTMVKQQTID